MGAMTAKLFYVEITGKRRDTETVMRRLEGGDWKSTSNGNSLVAYPTSCTVLETNGVGDNLVEFNIINWSFGAVDGSFFPWEGGGEEIAYGGNGKGVLIYTLTEGNGMQLVVRQVNLAG